MIALEQELKETVKVWPVVSKVVSTIHTKTNYTKTGITDQPHPALKWAG